jgi:hypothetical protein
MHQSLPSVERGEDIGLGLAQDNLAQQLVIHWVNYRYRIGDLVGRVHPVAMAHDLGLTGEGTGQQEPGEHVFHKQKGN